MTREEKIQYRKDRAHQRKSIRMLELGKIRRLIDLEGYSFKIARKKVRNQDPPFICEMGYVDCEERGYCNGDC